MNAALTKPMSNSELNAKIQSLGLNSLFNNIKKNYPEAASVGGGKTHYTFTSTEFHKQNGNSVRRNIRICNGKGTETVITRVNGKTKKVTHRFTPQNVGKVRKNQKSRKNK